jgi:hypothetical protein
MLPAIVGNWANSISLMQAKNKRAAELRHSGDGRAWMPCSGGGFCLFAVAQESPIWTRCWTDASVLSSPSFVTRQAGHNSASRRQRNSMGLKTFQRNQLIMLASLDGVTAKELARQFNLAPKSIIEIIRNERHRLAVSPHPAYRALRKSGVRGQSRPQ